MARLAKRDVERIVGQAIQHSTWADDAETKQNFTDALDSYYSRLESKPKTTDGLSGISSSDVSDMVEAVVAQIMPAFDFDEVAIFTPSGPMDVEQSRLESRVCNSYLRHQNNGYGTIQQALRNALLLRNGILKVWTETNVSTETKSYENANAIELDRAMTPTHPNQTVEIVGEPEVTDDSFTGTIRKTTELRRLSIDSTDPIRMIVAKNWDEISLFNCPLVGEQCFMSRSDLIAMGYPKATVNKLNQTNTDSSYTAQARARDNDGATLYDYGHDALANIEVFELYMLLDVDGDGVAERRRIIYAGGAEGEGGTVLSNEPWWGVPYASGTPFIAPQRWLGISLYDKLADLEVAKTDALRQYADNLAYANNSEVVVADGAVNLDDLKARRPGGINRADDPNMVKELTVRSNGQESQAFLNYMDQVRSERGGASLDLQSAQIQLSGDTAHGIERQYTSKEMLSQLMTRTLAETLIRETIFLIHETLRRDFPAQATFNTGSQFVVAEPGRWPYRDEITIVAGMSHGERRERRAVLEAVLERQAFLDERGYGDGILVDMPTYYATLMDWAAAGGIQTPRRYFIDPRTPESQQAQDQKRQEIAEAAQAEQDMARQLLDTQLGVEREKTRGQLIAKMGELKFKYWDRTLESLELEGDQGGVDNLQKTGKRKANEQPGSSVSRGATA